MNNASSRGRRVVITGAGVVSPIGNSLEEVWSSLLHGQCGIAKIEQLPTDHLVSPWGAEARQFAGAIGDFGPLEPQLKKGIRKGLKVMCRETMMAVAAAQHALADAGTAPELAPERSGVVFGCDYMLSTPMDMSEGMLKCGAGGDGFRFGEWGSDGLGEMFPLWMLRYLPNMPASHIAIFNDMRGPNNSLTQREASGLMAIAEGAQTIARGHADRVLAGATGTRIHAMKSIHAVQTEQLAPPGDDPRLACRPFDQQRSGMVLGEGAGAVVLESFDSAQARGATIYGEIAGIGNRCAADKQLVGLRREALGGAIHAALTAAEVTPSDVGHINAHGLATNSCDLEEARALDDALGPASRNIPVAAAKCFFGNLGAASGVVELIGSLLALRAGQLFPTFNYQHPDPDCPLAVAATADIAAGSSFLKQNVTPQGQAVALFVTAVHH